MTTYTQYQSLLKANPPCCGNLFSFSTPGTAGEQFVVRMLSRHVFCIWKKNWRIREGEIDIVAHRGRALHFVEVKTRHARTREPFSAERAVDLEKTNRLRFLADRFEYHFQKQIRRHRIRSFQFDIASVEYRRTGPLYSCTLLYYANAFPYY